MSTEAVVISPSMTLLQIAELARDHRRPGYDSYVKIEWSRNQPRAYLVVERYHEDVPVFLRRQAE